jgi:hypothetical protein
MILMVKGLPLPGKTPLTATNPCLESLETCALGCLPPADALWAMPEQQGPATSIEDPVPGDRSAIRRLPRNDFWNEAETASICEPRPAFFSPRKTVLPRRIVPNPVVLAHDRGG